jgi:hypothetical protein
MYEFKYQNKLFNLLIFKFSDKMTQDDISKYNEDIAKISTLKLKNIYISYDIRNIKSIDMSTFSKNINLLLESTNKLKNSINGCSILANSTFLNTIKMIFQIIPYKICKNYLVTKDVDEAFLYLNKLNQSQFSNLKLEI